MGPIVPSQSTQQGQPVARAVLGDTGEAYPSALIRTAFGELFLPIDVALSPEVRAAGPSARPVVGLTVYELLAEEVPRRGPRISELAAGTLDGALTPLRRGTIKPHRGGR